MSGPNLDAVNKRCGEIIILYYYCRRPGRFLKIRASKTQLRAHRHCNAIPFNLLADPGQKVRLRISWYYYNDRRRRGGRYYITIIIIVSPRNCVYHPNRNLEILLPSHIRTMISVIPYHHEALYYNIIYLYYTDLIAHPTL